MPSADDELLTEIRDRFKEATDLWRPIRDEGKTDIRYISGDPWEATEREAREALKRPVISVDELNQYSNQLINNALTHPRAIKVAPRGMGATDKTAALRADKIREIEYRSNARTAYATMFQNTVERSYGFARVTTKWEPGQWRQQLWIDKLVNPDLVTPDPWMLDQTGADMRYCFIHELRDEVDFKKGGEFAGAKMVSFDSEAQRLAPQWIRGRKIQVAEYWKLKSVKRLLLELKPLTPDGRPISMWADVVPPKDMARLKADGDILRDRLEDDQQACMYLTNGVEILKDTEWKGRYIPIVSCLGKVLYVDQGTGAERNILSLIRLARSPQMLLCYYRTQQAEIAGMIPKTPVMGPKGMFRGVEYEWQKVPHEPLAFIEYNIVQTESGQDIATGPIRLPYDPGGHLQSLELCAEGARRAIQAALGSYALPTTAQRHNEKSGVALEQIKENTQVGSFHFLDHYDDSVRQIGIVTNDLLAHTHDTMGPITVRTLDGQSEDRPINDPAQPESMLTTGEHDIIISSGPSLDSQREEANQLVDSLVGNQQVLQIIGPQKAVKLLAAAVRLRNPGPAGDIMANIIDPPPDGQHDPLHELQMTKAALQHVTQVATEMKQAIDAKVIETQGKKDIAAMQEHAESNRAAADREVKLAVAELGAKVERLALFMEERARLGSQAHEVALATADAGHEQLMGDEAHQQAQAQTAQAAALAPPPTAEAGA